MNKARVMLLAFGLLLSTCAVSVATISKFLRIDFPFAGGQFGTYVFGANNKGQVVGFTYDGTGAAHSFESGSDANLIQLDVPDTLATFAHGINDAGHIAGSFVDQAGVHGFTYVDGAYAMIDAPLATKGTVPYGINNREEIVGYFANETGTHGFLYAAGAFTVLDNPGGTDTVAYGINQSGQIVGTFRDSSGTHSFLYHQGKFTRIESPIEASLTLAYGVNDGGQIVGTFLDGEGMHGFISDGREFTTVDFPGEGGRTVMSGINNSGDVIGNVYESRGAVHGVLMSTDIIQPVPDRE